MKNSFEKIKKIFIGIVVIILGISYFKFAIKDSFVLKMHVIGENENDYVYVNQNRTAYFSNKCIPDTERSMYISMQMKEVRKLNLKPDTECINKSGFVEYR